MIMNQGYEIPVPAGEIAKRPLQFFWIADYSGSMAGKKIAVLNNAIREALPAVRSALASHPEVEVMMRAIKFSDSAEWHVGPQAVSLESFVWPELATAGGTSTAQAIRLLANELVLEKMPRRGYPPVCILISDGFCTDPKGEYDTAINELNSHAWGKRAVRLAIAVGAPNEYDESELIKFVTHQEIGVLKWDPEHEPESKLISLIRWASVAASVGASIGKSNVAENNNNSNNVTLPPPPYPSIAINNTDVF
jgi:uncharacterized protein YegL